MPYVETKQLSKHFGGVAALNTLSISLAEGRVTSIIGPNGSGKTTLTNVLTGVLPRDGGTIVIGGVAIDRLVDTEVATYGLTRTFQMIRLFEQMSVLDNILVVLTERSLGRALIERHGDYHREEARRVLQRVGLWEKRNELVENLSYGQRKLVEIARALSMKAELYLFDEPFAGLFPAMRDIVIEVIKELRMQGKTVVLIEHTMDIIRALSDHVIVLDAGRLLAEGAPEEVLARADVIEAYLGQ